MESKMFHKKLMSLVMPIAFAQFMLALVSASDAVMLGRLNSQSMSAVSLAGQVQFVLSLFLAAVTAGVNMFAAQYWGKKDIPTVEKIFAMALRASAVIGLIFTLICAFAPGFFMRILTNDKTLIGLGADYLRAVSLSYLLCSISQIYLCIMKNSAQAAISTVISSSAVIINIIFNAVLIFGLFGINPLGIKGAAYATVLARLWELLCVIVNAGRKNSIHLKSAPLLHTDKVLRNEIVRRTLPVLGNELVWGLGFSMSCVIIGRLGEDAVAANSIASVVRNLAVCFCIGLASGGGILVGNELGAGKPESAKACGKKVTWLSVVSGAITGLLLLTLIPVIISFANLNETASCYLKYMLTMSTCWMLGKSINCATVGGIFCAGGDSRFGFICDTIVLWFITVPLGLLAAFVFRLPVLVVYFIINLDEIIKLPAVCRNYKKYKWVKDLTQK